MTTSNKIVLDDHLCHLSTLKDGVANLVYINPPFNTGKRQERHQLKTIRDEEGGERTGFKGNRYRTVKLGNSGYADSPSPAPRSHLRPRMASRPATPMKYLTSHTPWIGLALLVLSGCVGPRPSMIELDDEPAVVLKTVNISDRVPFYAGFAHHAWIDLRCDGAADWIRVEVDWGLQVGRIESEQALEDRRWSMPVWVLASWHGEEAARMIPEILEATVRQIKDEPSTGRGESSFTDSATGVVTRTNHNTGEVTQTDPTSGELTVVTHGDHKQLFRESWPMGRGHTWRYDYEAWPGPNSNTFVATLLREVAGLDSELDHNSVGKDWSDGVRVGRTDAGLGFGIDSTYLGAAAGLRQGVELRLIGLTTGVSLWPPAVKIPFLPRIGIHPGWVNARWW